MDVVPQKKMEGELLEILFSYFKCVSDISIFVIFLNS